MQFKQCLEGDFVIYAGAMESVTQPGYLAAVVVMLVRGATQEEVYRVDRLAQLFPSSEEALRQAINIGQRAIRRRADGGPAKPPALRPRRRRAVERMLANSETPSRHPATRFL